MHSILRYCRVAGLVVAALLAASGARADDYPSKPITILCWSKPGSPVDVYARVVSQLLSKQIGQPVVVETKTGGGGVVAANTMLSRPADGYMVLAVTDSLTTVFGEPGVTFKPTDFQMIARGEIDPFAIIVKGDSPFKSLKDLIGYAKAHPGDLTVSGPFALSAHRVHWEGLAQKAGVTSTWIPYAGGSAAVLAVAGGDAKAGVSNPGNLKAQVAAGKIRIIGVATEQRLADFPNVPTYKEQGYDYITYHWRGIAAKAGTPRPIVDKLAQALHAVQQDPAYQDYLKKVSQTDGWDGGPDKFQPSFLDDVKSFAVLKKKLGL